MTDTTELLELQSQITPGPWAFDYPVSYNPDFVRIMAGDLGLAGDRYMHVSGNTEPADARLIAMAPDLLARVIALEAALAAERANADQLATELRRATDYGWEPGEASLAAHNELRGKK